MQHHSLCNEYPKEKPEPRKTRERETFQLEDRLFMRVKNALVLHVKA